MHHSAEANTLSLRLHGVPVIAPAGGPWLHLERKDAAWLAVLALNGPTARDTLAGWLWPDAALKTANVSLRQRIFRLRKRLGHELVSAATTVALLPGTHIEPSDDLPADLASAPSAGGALLAAFEYEDCPTFAEWLHRQRELHRAQRRDQLTRAAQESEAAGELERALVLTEALLADDALSEHAQRRLIRLHYLRGDRAAAITQYERFEQLLRDELGARPSVETQALLATVERAAPLPATAPARAVVPASLKRPPRMVGRSRELAALGAAWAAERVFVALGEAGMGKSRLLAEFAAGRQSALTVQARPGDAGVPFALLARLLRALRERCPAEADEGTRHELSRVLPELGAGSATTVGEAQRLVLQRAVEWQLVSAAAAPSGSAELLLDDLHFADEASLEMLQSLVTSERLGAWRWGLAQRGDEGAAAARALREGLAESQRLQEVMLVPLGFEAMTELVETLDLPEANAPELAAALLRHTGGNPLFALETLKDMVLQGAASGALPQPATVGVLIERRLRALSERALALARVAAIAGPDFGIEMAECVLRTPALALADAWSELEAAQVLSGGGFAHDLVFDAVRRSVPDTIARHARADVAVVLEGRGAEPARVAEHWHAAGAFDAAARSFEKAAERARLAGRLAETLALWRRAAEDHRRFGKPREAWRCELQCVDNLAHAQGGKEALALAQRLADEAEGAEERVLALTAVGLAHSFAMDWGRAAEAATQALHLGATVERPGLLLDAAAMRATAWSRLGRPAEAIDEVERTRPLLDSLGTPRQRISCLNALAYAQNLADRPLASIETLEQLIELSKAAGDTRETVILTGNLAIMLAAVGRSSVGLAQARAAALLAQSHGWGAQAPILNRMAAAAMAMAVGEYRVALPELEEMPALAKSAGTTVQATAENHLATLWLTLGQWHRAERVLRSDEGLGHAPTACRRLTLRARLRRLRGQEALHRIANDLQEHRAQLRDKTPARILSGMTLELSRMVAPEAALLEVRATRTSAMAAGLLGLALHALVREMDLLLKLEPERALVLLETLEREQSGVTLTDGYTPEVWLVATQACVAAGRTGHALRCVTNGCDWIRRVASAELEPAFRRSFLDANPVNRDLLMLERRLANAAG